MAQNEMRALPREQIGGLEGMLQTEPLRRHVRVVEPLRVLALRHLPGGASRIHAAVEGLGFEALAGVGQAVGADPCLVWRNPAEWLLLGRGGAGMDQVGELLRPTAGATAYAVDQSDGCFLVELDHDRLDDWLARLIDSGAIPRQTGQASRARLADIAVLAIRRSPSCAWLLVDRTHDHYLLNWLAYAAVGLTASTS